MEHIVLTKPQQITEQDKMDEVKQSLEVIEHKLDTEIIAKQKTIDQQEQEIQRLHGLVEEKNRFILEINEKHMECMRNSEGNRQLINKLLNDSARLQQDIEWYKRTYVKRSLLGTIQEKLFRK